MACLITSRCAFLHTGLLGAVQFVTSNLALVIGSLKLKFAVCVYVCVTENEIKFKVTFISSHSFDFEYALTNLRKRT